MCWVGTFWRRWGVSEPSWVKIDDDLPLETVALVGCGVPTGWGTAVNAGAVRPGGTTVIYGIGGAGGRRGPGPAGRGARTRRAVAPRGGWRATAAGRGALRPRGSRRGTPPS